VGISVMRWLLRLLLLLTGADDCTSENRQENECAGEANHYSPFLSALNILPRRSQRRTSRERGMAATTRKPRVAECMLDWRTHLPAFC